MRIMTISHGITTVTGFGQQHLKICRAAADAGHEVFSIHKDYRGMPFTFGPGSKTEFGQDLSGITLLPWGAQTWCEDKLPYYIEVYKPDIVFTLGDIWCYQWLSELHRGGKWTWIALYEFDTENMVGFWHQSVANADISVVPAQFAYDMLKKDHKNVLYIPHTIDTDTFVPATYEEKIAIRKETGFDKNDFIISCVAHNQQRKMLARLIRAFEIFAKGKNDVKLFMHTQAKDYTGWDIPQIVIDHHLENKIVLSDKTAKMIGDVHVSPRMMRDYYVMSDVHAITSGGEGFGIPMVEAMACGIPNVAPAYTTPKEFLCDKIMKDGVETLENGVRGFAIPYVDIEHHFTGGIWALVDCEKMAASFQTLYENPTLRHQMGTKARKFAVENYDDKPIKNKWVELFERAPEIAKKMAEEDETPHKEYIRAVRFNAGQHK